MNVSLKSFLLLFVFANLSLFSKAQDSWHPLKYIYSENTGWATVKDDINNSNISIFSYSGKQIKLYKLFIKVQNNKVLFLTNDRIDREIILHNAVSSVRERVDSFARYRYIKYESTALIKDKGFERTGTVEFGTIIINFRKYDYIKTLKYNDIIFVW